MASEHEITQVAHNGFVKPRWRPRVIEPEGNIDRHFYELCTLSELRDRLRAGDVWVRGSRQYPSFETYLIPTKAFVTEPLPTDHNRIVAVHGRMSPFPVTNQARQCAPRQVKIIVVDHADLITLG